MAIAFADMLISLKMPYSRRQSAGMAGDCAGEIVSALNARAAARGRRVNASSRAEAKDVWAST
jgi:hypothetical protein